MLRGRNNKNKMVQRYKLPEEKTEQQAIRSGRCRSFPICAKRKNRYRKEGKKKKKRARQCTCYFMPPAVRYVAIRTVNREKKNREKTNATISLLYYVAMGKGSCRGLQR